MRHGRRRPQVEPDGVRNYATPGPPPHSSGGCPPRSPAIGFRLMVEAPPPPSPRRDDPQSRQLPLATGTLAILALATLALHAAFAHRYGYFRDELYYIACGRRLAWGYVDHPPMIALIAAFATRVLGGSLLALRILPALAHAALVFVSGVIAQRLGGGRFAQGLAALAVLVGPVYLGSADALNMNPFDQLLWGACMLVIAGALARGVGPSWVVLGALMGLGLMTKHSSAFFIAAFGAALILAPKRAWLRTRGPWLALLIAVLVMTPNLAWEIRHHWPTLEFLHNASAHKNYAAPLLGFLAAQALIIGPLSVVLVAAGLPWLLGARAGAPFRVLGVAFVAVFVLLFAMKAKHYYLAPAYPVVFAAGAVALERLTASRWRWARPAYLALLAATGLALVPFTIPVLEPAALERYIAWLGIQEPQSERHRPARLPQQYADMFGWKEMTAKVAEIYHRLPPAEQRRCIVFASNYGEAGALEWFGPAYGLPKVASGHNSYLLWGPPDTAADIVITVGEDSIDVAKSLRVVERAGVFSNDWNMPYESDLPILIGRRLRMPWRELWPRTKHYI